MSTQRMTTQPAGVTRRGKARAFPLPAGVVTDALTGLDVAAGRWRGVLTVEVECPVCGAPGRPVLRPRDLPTLGAVGGGEPYVLHPFVTLGGRTVAVATPRPGALVVGGSWCALPPRDIEHPEARCFGARDAGEVSRAAAARGRETRAMRVPQQRPRAASERVPA